MDEINKTVLDYSKKKDKEYPLKYDLKENVSRFKRDMYDMYGKRIATLFTTLSLSWSAVPLNHFRLIIKIRISFSTEL